MVHQALPGLILKLIVRDNPYAISECYSSPDSIITIQAFYIIVFSPSSEMMENVEGSHIIPTKALFIELLAQ